MSNQGMPNQATPLINPDGTINVVWYRFFLSMYTLTGMGLTPILGVNNATYNNTGFLYRKPSGGSPNGTVIFFNPDFPSSVIHANGILLTF